VAARRQARRQDPQHQGHLLARFGLVQPAHQHQQGNRGDQEAGAGGLQDSTITPSGLWADVLLPIATHFERHDVALPWYKGHYYIHRPKAIEPMGESKTDFQVFTELATAGGARSGAQGTSASATTRKAERDYFDNPDAVDEAYLPPGGRTRCRTTRA
jgi:anaerobic selenocysteine-containing dehydrogenase